MRCLVDLLAVIISLVSLGPAASAGESNDWNSVVRIYAVKRAPGDPPHECHGAGAGGAGFFIDNAGTVVTAYHVIEGASCIEVHDAQGTSSRDVTVLAFSPSSDLAKLHIGGVHSSSPLRIAPVLPKAGENIHVYGFPYGAPQELFKGSVTSSGFTTSTLLRSSTNDAIFAERIDVLVVDVSIYGGMSGGPVVYAGKVIGVLSGSWNEGRGLTWAIPLKYLSSTIPIGKPPGEITWPKLQLMASSWKRMTRSYALDDKFQSMSVQLESEIDGLQKVFERVSLDSNKVHASYLLLRATAPRVGEFETAEQFATASGMATTLDTLQEYLAATRDLGERLSRIYQVALSMATWLYERKGKFDDDTYDRVYPRLLIAQAKAARAKSPLLVPLSPSEQQSLLARTSRVQDAMKVAYHTHDPKELVRAANSIFAVLDELATDWTSPSMGAIWQAEMLAYYRDVSVIYADALYRPTKTDLVDVPVDQSKNETPIPADMKTVVATFKAKRLEIQNSIGVLADAATKCLELGRAMVSFKDKPLEQESGKFVACELDIDNRMNAAIKVLGDFTAIFNKLSQAIRERVERAEADKGDAYDAARVEAASLARANLGMLQNQMTENHKGMQSPMQKVLGAMASRQDYQTRMTQNQSEVGRRKLIESRFDGLHEMTTVLCAFSKFFELEGRFLDAELALLAAASSDTPLRGSQDVGQQ